jgi:DNA-binding transcriptional MerR regulator
MQGVDSAAAADFRLPRMIRIGDFARLARVSVRALRLYEEKGLLAPAHVDPHSRYRYYDFQQLATLERLLLLKDVGFPLASIRTLLQVAPPELRDAMARHRAAIRRQLREQEALLARVTALEAWLDSKREDALDGVVRTKSYPPVRALCLRSRVAPGSDAIAKLFDAAERRARRSRIDQAPMLLMHGTPHGSRRLDVEVCIPVTRACRLDEVREIEREPLAASVTYRGPYASTDELYRKMRVWLSRQQLALARRPIREIYHRFGADQVGYRLAPHRVADSAHRFVTEVAIPLVQVAT